MEIIAPSEITRATRDRLVVVAHSHTGLTRGLDHGEAVILVAQDGEHHVARVIDIDFEPDDTIYTIELGGRIPFDLARERAAGLDPDEHDLSLQQIVDLLHGLRRHAELRLTPGLATT